ncbi:MAG: hypothetical protein N7Q72_04110, partial [Spiroplasma sp. Tabriz.8]|nr:hypothetical protein [Spiroplasma sp. Tabriz.8]
MCNFIIIFTLIFYFIFMFVCLFFFFFFAVFENLHVIYIGLLLMWWRSIVESNTNINCNIDFI